MSPHPASAVGRAGAAEVRQELLGRLGVRADASDADVEAAHNGLVEFLELAPDEVNSWATAETAEVDEAFALLSGPEADLIPATRVSLDKAPEVQSPPPVIPTEPATPAPPAPAPSAVRKLMQPKTLWAVVPVLVVAVVLAVFFMGKRDDVPGINGTPTGTQTTASSAATATPVDQAKVGALMKKVSANPKDVASLQALGTAYFAAADYKTSSAWTQKVLAVDPKNKTALLSFGAAQFNAGNQAAAKKSWLVAAKLYPKEAEVHYDLGFLYMSQKPPDTVNMKIEWAKVVAIDPNSSLAKAVSTTITGTKTPAPAATK